MAKDLQSCPFSSGKLGDRFRPYEQEGMFEILKEARESEPVFYNGELNCWVVTKKMMSRPFSGTRIDFLPVTHNPQ